MCLYCDTNLPVARYDIPAHELQLDRRLSVIGKILFWQRQKSNVYSFGLDQEEEIIVEPIVDNLEPDHGSRARVHKGPADVQKFRQQCRHYFRDLKTLISPNFDMYM
jgi:hypothetical protein